MARVRKRKGEKEGERGRKTPLEAPSLSPLSPPGNMPAFPKTPTLRASSPCCPPPGEGDGEIYVMVTKSLSLLNSPSPLTAWESDGEFEIGGRLRGVLLFLNRGALRVMTCQCILYSHV